MALRAPRVALRQRNRIGRGMLSHYLPAVWAGLAALLGAVLGWLLRGLEEHRRDRVALLSHQNAAQENAAIVLEEFHSLSDDVAAHLQDHVRDVEGLQRELSELIAVSPALAPIVQRLMDVNLAVRDELAEAQTRLVTQSELIDRQTHEAQTDPLTKLPNRRGLESELQRRFSAFETDGTAFSVAVIDVDHFKRLNDTLGHLAGDAVLKGVAETLEKHSPPGALVARFGGEEFVMIVDGTIDPERDGGVERCRIAISAHIFRWEEKPFSISASLGCATIEAGESYLSLLGRADQALYASKRGGRACSHWHDGRTALRLTPIAHSSDSPQRLIEAVRQRPPQESSRRASDKPLVPKQNRAPRATPTLGTAEAFVTNVARRIFDWRRGGTIVSVVIVRVDRVEQLRSRWGEETCEAVHRAVSQFVVAFSRSIDHTAKREDGDLLLMLPGVSLRDATRIAHRIHKAVQQFELPQGQEKIHATVSIGVATCQEGDNSDELIGRGSKALEHAINSGRDGVHVHNGALIAEMTQLFSRGSIEEMSPTA
jgi:diguanylate cyclase